MPPERDPEAAARDRNPAEVALARLLHGDLFKDHVLSRLNHTDVSCLCQVNSGLRIYIKQDHHHMYIARFVKSLESFEWALANGLTIHLTRQCHFRYTRVTREGLLTLAHAVEAGNLDVIKRVEAVLRQANPNLRFHKKDWNAFREMAWLDNCLLYTSPSPRDKRQSRMPSSA